MAIVGIICEYNPLHNGHRKQIRLIRQMLGEDTTVVCCMSGNFVQRGAPAIINKSLRAKMAVLVGADLVLELPVTYALSSAEGFAAGGVRILSHVCDYLCFGCETGNVDSLMATAKALLSEAFPPLLREELDQGKSFPAARQAALEAMGCDADILSRPNDILAVEYCKAIIAQGSSMKPLPIIREGSYHAELPEMENPSATAVRKLMLAGLEWDAYVPLREDAPLHTLAAGERAMLARLRTMTDAEFEALPYGSEGLWRKFMHACRSCATLEEIIAATKSKRYTRTRIDRMVMCAFLGITKETLEFPVPYTRVLAFNDAGRSALKQMKQHTACINTGESYNDPYWEMEKRWESLYGLFCLDTPDAPDAAENHRVYYHKESQ